MEKPLSLLGYLAEQQNIVAEKDRVSGNLVHNAVGGELGFRKDDELTDAYSGGGRKGLTNLFQTGDKKLEWADFFQDPGEYIRSSLSTGFLGIEKKMIPAT